MVKFLCDNGADIMILNNNEKMASQEAYEKGYYEVSVY